jgi:hypothetical protein
VYRTVASRLAGESTQEAAGSSRQQAAHSSGEPLCHLPPATCHLPASGWKYLEVKFNMENPKNAPKLPKNAPKIQKIIGFFFRSQNSVQKSVFCVYVFTDSVK